MDYSELGFELHAVVLIHTSPWVNHFNLEVSHSSPFADVTSTGDWVAPQPELLSSQQPSPPSLSSSWFLFLLLGHGKVVWNQLQLLLQVSHSTVHHCHVRERTSTFLAQPLEPFHGGRQLPLVAHPRSHCWWGWWPLRMGGGPNVAWYGLSHILSQSKTPIFNTVQHCLIVFGTVA
jgi:hypothetical protein